MGGRNGPATWPKPHVTETNRVRRDTREGILRAMTRVHVIHFWCGKQGQCAHLRSPFSATWMSRRGPCGYKAARAHSHTRTLARIGVPRVLHGCRTFVVAPRFFFNHQGKNGRRCAMVLPNILFVSQPLSARSVAGCSTPEHDEYFESHRHAKVGEVDRSHRPRPHRRTKLTRNLEHTKNAVDEAAAARTAVASSSPPLGVHSACGMR